MASLVCKPPTICLNPQGQGSHYFVITQSGLSRKHQENIKYDGEARKRSPEELILPGSSHSSILAWKTMDRGAWRLQSMRLQSDVTKHAHT